MNISLSILLKRKIKRIENPSAVKLNGPVGLNINISERGDIYIKGKCIFSNLEPIYLTRFEVTNEYLIDKPITIILKEEEHINQLINDSQEKYFHPILKENTYNTYTIKRPPDYTTISVNNCIPRLPLTGFTITNPQHWGSELMIDMTKDSQLYITNSFNNYRCKPF